MNSMIKSSIFMALAAFVGTQAATTYGPVTIDTIKVTKTNDKTNWQPAEIDWVVATIDMDSAKTTLDIPKDVVVDSVYIKKNYKKGVTTTIMLPFDVITGGVQQPWGFENSSDAPLEVFQYVKVTKDWDGDEYNRAPWVVYVNHPYPGVMQANVPYLITPRADLEGFSPNLGYNNTATLNTTTNTRQVEYGDKYGSWNFIGTYDYKVWEEGDPELGRVFGFAARDVNDIKAGEFVKGKAGIKIRPMRAYLKCLKTGSAAAKMASYASIDDEVLPDTLEVRILEDDSTTSVHFGTMNMRTGEMLKDNWVDLNGRKLYRKPTTKGIYYNNGIKVIIK